MIEGLKLQKNYCTADGACTIDHGDEGNCTYYTQAQTSGLCIYCAWTEGKCLSPFALQAAGDAKETA